MKVSQLKALLSVVSDDAELHVEANYSHEIVRARVTATYDCELREDTIVVEGKSTVEIDNSRPRVYLELE
jgi:hypothetical protein